MKSTILLVSFLSLLTWNCTNKNFENATNTLTNVDEKQKGAHVFGIQDSTNFQAFIESNIEWITLVSWGFQKDYDSPLVKHHRGDSLQMREHDAHWINRIKSVRAAGFKVFFKPHLWLGEPSEGKWRSDVFPASEENWEDWKESYRDFILRYAKVAEQADAEMYCIGTEFTRLTIEKADYWDKLIQEVRAVYSGKITYAANWYEEYEKITFWNDLDYIGIQAYFPLVSNNYPTVQEIAAGWSQYLSTIETIHKKYNKKVLFTEMGYKSTADSAIKPWEWMENSPNQQQLESMETQANCYQAFFDTVWKKEWFAGVHIWQMRGDFEESDYNDLDFTPQAKPAEKVITKGFE